MTWKAKKVGMGRSKMKNGKRGERLKEQWELSHKKMPRNRNSKWEQLPFMPDLWFSFALFYYVPVLRLYVFFLDNYPFMWSVPVWSWYGSCSIAVIRNIIKAVFIKTSKALSESLCSSWLSKENFTNHLVLLMVPQY